MAMFLYPHSIYKIMVKYESIGQIFCMFISKKLWYSNNEV